MKFTHVSIIAVMLVVIAVAIAGCSSSQPAPSGSSTPAATSAGSAASPAATPAAAAATQGSGSGASSGTATGSQLFGGLNYDWVEYKMVGGSGADQMTIFYKYNQKTGKCSMRFEGAAAAAMGGAGSEMDCSSTGSSGSSSNPNDVKSDVQFVKVGTEVVTVPAGTFTADKYTATSQGMTSTYWIVNGKPLIKMQGGDSTGSVVMELNGMG